MSAPWLGAVADDVTGACDLAAGVAATGARTAVLLGAPDDRALPDADCLVVALKVRTVPAAVAAETCRAAGARLLAGGAGGLYQKYCSTFDSTPAGNIGPIAEALAGLLPGAMSVGTPATPAVGRTVYRGHLFVGDRLLSESPMRDHPLTPMRDADLVRVLGRQVTGPVGLIPLDIVARGAGAVADALAAHRAAGTAHVLLDAVTDDDLDTLAAALTPAPGGAGAVVLGGAAGLATALARRRGVPDRDRGGLGPVPAGRRLVLAGSCSARTREQVAAFGGTTVRVDPETLAAEGDPGAGLRAALSAAYRADPEAPVLVAATADPHAVRRAQRSLGRERAAHLVEDALARLARYAVAELSVRRIILAGGETSGAVLAALGVHDLRVGPLAAPGVPWTVPATGPPLAVLLKSGNFGDRDLFRSAWASCP